MSHVLQLIIRILFNFFEIERKVTESTERSLELNESDKRLLAACTKDALTALMKRMGVKTLEAAERLINNFGGWQILAVLFFTFFIAIVQEIPRSPRWLRSKADAERRAKENPADPNAPPRPRVGLLGALDRFRNRAGAPAWSQPPPPTPPPDPNAPPSGTTPG